MITRNVGRARRKQALSSSRIGGKTDEMDAVGEAGIDVGEIVADIDDTRRLPAVCSPKGRPGLQC